METEMGVLKPFERDHMKGRNAARMKKLTKM